MTKQEFLAVYEAETGVELCETTKAMWLGQPWPAFLAKLEEVYAWAGCGGKVVFGDVSIFKQENSSSVGMVM